MCAKKKVIILDTRTKHTKKNKKKVNAKTLNPKKFLLHPNDAVHIKHTNLK